MSDVVLSSAVQESVVFSRGPARRHLLLAAEEPTREVITTYLGEPGKPGPPGEPGPPGPPVDKSTLSFDYSQHHPSALWTVIHNLGFRPVAVRVHDLAGREHDPEVVTSSAVATVLRFTVPVAGTATLS